jgi:predicted MFS family arabinose efflux permease
MIEDVGADALTPPSAPSRDAQPVSPGPDPQPVSPSPDPQPVSPGPDAQPAQWMVVAAFALVVLATQLLWLTFAPIDTDVAHDFHVSKNAIGWLANVFPLVYVLIALPAGLALDRWFRSTLMLGAALAALGGLVRLAAPTYGWAMAGQLIAACAQPLVLNAITKVATGYLPPARRAVGIAVGSAAQFLGAIVALVLGPLLEGRHDVRLLLSVEAAIACGAVVTLAVGLRRAPTESGPAAGAGMAELRAAWSVSMVRTLAAIMFVGVGVFVAISTYLQPILHHDRISSTAAGLMLAGMLLAGVAGCAISPPIVARRGAQRGYLVLAVVCVTAAMVVLSIAHAVTALDFVAIAGVGFLLLAALPVILELTERRMGNAGGVATGILLLMGNLGGLIVAVAVGLVSGTPAAAFLLLAGVTLCALPIARRVRSAPADTASGAGGGRVPERAPLI